MIHYNIFVSGKVQGVFFRQSAFDIAVRLGVKGFVRNEANGGVIIEAEGSEAELQKFVTWCKKGTPRAVVSEVRCLEGEIKNYSSFEIRR